MYYSEKVKQAMLDSFNAHKDDFDKNGYPYFHHPLTLALQFDSEEEVCVALLHDVVEDHGDKYPLSYIRATYGDAIADAVGLMTHDENVPYLDYVNEIKKNPIARNVKLADLRHNTDLSRLNYREPPKYETYIKAIDILSDFEREKDFCRKWVSMLESIQKDSKLKMRCEKYNGYIHSEEDEKLRKQLSFDSFLEEGYDSGIVRQDYRKFGEDIQEAIFEPTDEFVEKLSEVDLVRCIAWHFRADHFDNGCLISDSLASGSLLKYFKALLK